MPANPLKFVSVDLSKPVTVPASSHNTVLYEGVIDKKCQRVAFAQIRFSAVGAGRNIELWRGDAYDAVGQYTDDDVIARLRELLSGAVLPSV